MIFLKACDLLRVKPEDAVHVGDDRRNDIWGARDAGCDAWLWGSDVYSFKEVSCLHCCLLAIVMITFRVALPPPPPSLKRLILSIWYQICELSNSRFFGLSSVSPILNIFHCTYLLTIYTSLLPEWIKNSQQKKRVTAYTNCHAIPYALCSLFTCRDRNWGIPCAFGLD